MIVKFDNGEIKEINFSGTVSELFSFLGLNKEEFLVSVKGDILTSDESLLSSDEVLLISVVSGG